LISLFKIANTKVYEEMMNNKRRPLGQLADFPFCLAPMVGLSHVVLRDLVRKYLPAGSQTIWPTEMLSSRRLVGQRLGETPETFTSAIDTNLVPQILVNEDRFIQASVPKLEKWGAVGIDINMGCPQSKALKHNYGVALMGDPEYAHNVVRMSRRHTNLPLSVKLRAGTNNDREFLKRFCEGLYQAGADWLTLHPRTPEQKRKGNADWSQIRMIKEEFQLPLIGNGDVQTWEDAIRMKEETGCDAVMIGRALTARPWMLWQIGHELGLPNPEGLEGPPPLTPEEEALEFGRALKFFVERSYEIFSERDAKKRVLFYTKVSHSWLNYGHSIAAKISKAKSHKEMIEAIEKFFQSTGLRMSQRTELRY
jgi:tRNA-dihydrouridine synthase B